MRSALARAIAHRLYTAPVCQTTSHDSYGDFQWNCADHVEFPEDALAKIVDKVLLTYVGSRPDMIMIGQTPVTLTPVERKKRK